MQLLALDHNLACPNKAPAFASKDPQIKYHKKAWGEDEQIWTLFALGNEWPNQKSGPEAFSQLFVKSSGTFTGFQDSLEKKGH